MPELPEVETIVRGLRPALQGTLILEVWWSGRPLRLARAPDLPGLRRICRGARVAGLRRVGKYLFMDLEQGGAPASSVLVHLGMSGRLRLQPATDPRAPHTHLAWTLDRGRELRLVDPRRFGWVRPVRPGDRVRETEALGPDPLAGLAAGALAAALASSRAPLKAFLLDQRRVAGLGNIYACEALFRARLHPAAAARRARHAAPALARAIARTLAAAIANRGTTLRDYVDERGDAGSNFAKLLVYGREGAPCRRCRTPIRRIVQSARSTFFCPRCQKR